VSYADVESIRNRGFGASGRGLHGCRAQMLKDSVSIERVGNDASDSVFILRSIGRIS